MLKLSAVNGLDLAAHLVDGGRRQRVTVYLVSHCVHQAYSAAGDGQLPGIRDTVRAAVNQSDLVVNGEQDEPDKLGVQREFLLCITV